MEHKQKEYATIKVVGIENTQGEWIGNISIDTKTMKITPHLKEGYKIATLPKVSKR